jgi:RNA polymerase sigma-70 factor, ECF subfamily
LTDKAARPSPPTGEAIPIPGPPGVPSLRRLFEDHARFIWRTARHLGVREADLEDVCQEVFLTAHRRLPGFEGRSSVRTWLYGICLRVASDYRRRAHVRRELPMAEPPHRVHGAHQDEDYLRKRARERLQQILAELDEDKRTVFVLYEIEDFPMKDVAAIVGCPLQTAYSRLHAARARVLAIVEASREQEP